jgi:hypothetical protein
VSVAEIQPAGQVECGVRPVYPPPSSFMRSDCFLLVVLVAVSRFLFRSRLLYDIDSVNFALALGKFDPSVHQPHPPGYFLYVMLGRLVNALTGDANLAFVLISIAASCGAVALIYLLTYEWFGRGPAICSALLFLFSPLAWFHGTVALTYIVECFFSALIGYLSWRLLEGRGSAAVLCMILGMGAGFRPSSALLLGPLCCYAILSRRPRRLLAGGAALCATCLAWFVPMVVLTGGPQVYFQSLVDLWQVAGGRDTVFTSSVAFSIARFMVIGAIACLCFGMAIPFGFVATAGRSGDDRGRARFIWFWVGPGLLFFTFVFLRFVNAGYLLFLSPPLFACLGSKLSAYWNGASRVWRPVIGGVLVAVNTAIFLLAPVYCSYRSIREFETQLTSLTAAVRREVPASDTMLVGFDSHFLGYRHAAYYLPEYLVVQFPEIRSGKRIGVFAAENRQTRFLTSAADDRFQKFMLLPLPPDDEDRAYIQKIYSRFPGGHLRTSESGGWLFASSDMADLRYLFARQ